MINPLAIAACLALGFGGLAFAFVRGDSEPTSAAPRS